MKILLGFDRGHLTPANLFRWNAKAGDSGNLHINVAPQVAKFNRGSWKTLEAAVECASRNRIHAIVATGIAGDSDYTIGRGIRAPKYFWKMVCYREQKSKQTYVALWVGNNEPADEETNERKRFTLTPRSQTDLNKFDSGALIFRNPWDGVLRMRENFALMARYPTIMFDCKTAANLPEEEVEKWKSHFKIFDNDDDLRRMTRATKSKEGAFCSRSQLDDLLASAFDDDDVIEDSEEGEDEDEASSSENESDDEDDDGEDDEEDFDIPDIPASDCGKRIVGYYPSWTKVPVSTSLFSKFTHIIFAFLEMKSDGTVGIGNPDHSSAQTLGDAEVEATARANLRTLMEAKANLPDLKVSFAVGGWENSQYFSAMAADTRLKQNFIASVLRTMDEYGFDGVDIDWEYPVKGGAHEGIAQVSFK